MPDAINAIDRDALRREVRQAAPFPFFKIDDFLVEDLAGQVADSFPSFSQAQSQGTEFKTVNERHKVQISDSDRFPPAIQRLNDALASPEFVDTLSHVLEIPRLLPDPLLLGGGIHETGPRGHLDIHVDFNYSEERDLHRRVNILLYFNKDWPEAWGGNVEFWDRDVKVLQHSFEPIFNRCVVFATSEISFHGTTAVLCPNGVSRKSFAAYYYTKEPPPNWTGRSHDTIFKARPDEVLKGRLLMPAERLKRQARTALQRAKSGVRRLLE